jgi:hypothetical protein
VARHFRSSGVEYRVKVISRRRVYLESFCSEARELVIHVLRR